MIYKSIILFFIIIYILNRNKLRKKMKKIIIFLPIFIVIIIVNLADLAKADEIKLSVLKYGTVNWELNVIKHYGLDKKYGIDLDITYLSNKNANHIALLTNEVDMIVTDWVWVSRQRDAGTDFTLVPYSTSAGAIMVPENSKIKTMKDIKGHKIGIAGGSIDKSWILIRAYSKKILNFDISKSIEAGICCPTP